MYVTVNDELLPLFLPRQLYARFLLQMKHKWKSWVVASFYNFPKMSGLFFLTHERLYWAYMHVFSQFSIQSSYSHWCSLLQTTGYYGARLRRISVFVPCSKVTGQELLKQWTALLTFQSNRRLSGSMRIYSLKVSYSDLPFETIPSAKSSTDWWTEAYQNSTKM